MTMEANGSEDLQVETRDGVAVLTMNRPERLNALSRSMIDGAIAALERCADDASIGCIVLTGAGRGFCAGGDVTAMGDASALAEMTMEQKVDRPCAGAGFGIALACDLRLAADSAKLTTAFAKVGFSGDFGITWPLVRTLGS